MAEFKPQSALVKIANMAPDPRNPQYLLIPLLSIIIFHASDVASEELVQKYFCPNQFGAKRFQTEPTPGCIPVVAVEPDAATNSDIRTGPDIGETPTPPQELVTIPPDKRKGGLTSSRPFSTGPSGPAIGNSSLPTTIGEEAKGLSEKAQSARSGPSIGDSSLNQQR